MRFVYRRLVDLGLDTYRSGTVVGSQWIGGRHEFRVERVVLDQIPHASVGILPHGWPVRGSVGGIAAGSAPKRGHG